jgi:hypothetical protein
MVASDIGSVPIACQGDRAQVLARIADLGSSALLAFDGKEHVGQLQFRRYEAGTRSPHGPWDPLYWMDFGDRAPDLPLGTLCVCCYHIGQRDNTADRDESYQGRAIAARLLDYFLDWARAGSFNAVIAKATPPYSAVMRFLGGLPAAAYEARGFKTLSRWVDADLAGVVQGRGLAPGSEIEAASTVACCTHRFVH